MHTRISTTRWRLCSMKITGQQYIRPSLFMHSRSVIISPRLSVEKSKGYCWACGTRQKWQAAKVINNELAQTWDLDQRLRDSFDYRESMFCPNCGCSLRLRHLAEALCYYYNGVSARELVADKEFNKLEIAEINSCGKLHQFLGLIKNLKYSEFGSKDPAIPSENLEKLSYKSNSLDLILSSDTFEHVPDFRKSTQEIYRVLKPGGMHIFTIPVIWKRATIQRAELTSNGKTKHHKEPSYHGEGQPDYLVFSEFGHDIVSTLELEKFTVELYKINLINLNDTGCVIIARKD